MNSLFQQTEDWLDVQLSHLAQLIPKPVLRRTEKGIICEFDGQSPKAAILLKLARIISGLRSARILLDVNLLQEQAAICRIVNELIDDVTFLALASFEADTPDILSRYLMSFFAPEESLNQLKLGNRVKGRDIVGRKQIHNYISQHPSSIGDSFTTSNVGLALSFAFSGYIHGNALHILEMYDPKTGRFQTNASEHHPLHSDHQNDIWNYYFRAILAVGLAAKAFDDDETMETYSHFRTSFEEKSGNRAKFE